MARPEEEHNDGNRTLKALGGGLLVVLGIAAVYGAAATSLAAVYVLGWVLIIAGVVGFVLSFAIHNAGGIALGLVSAILSFTVGFLLIANPLVSLGTLTLLLAMFFIVDGLIRIAVSFAETVEHRGWSFIYGVLLAVIGIAIWRHLPTTSLYIFGVFIGISLLLQGATILASSVGSLQFRHRPRYA